MTYKHLKDFLEQSSQKLFWIISWGNLAGAVAGVLAAYYLGKVLPWLPGVLLYVLGAGVGLAATWVHQGQPAYRVLLRWGEFQARRLFAGATLEVASREYYRRPVALTRPFTLEGIVSYSGEDSVRGETSHTGRIPAPLNPDAESRPGSRLPLLLPGARLGDRPLVAAPGARGGQNHHEET